MPADSLRSDQMRELAHRLIKDFRSGVPERSLPAARRFARLASFSTRPPEEILALGDRVQLKHALLVIALEHGRESWSAFKQWLASEEARSVADAADDSSDPVMYATGHDVLINRWFADYAEAKASLADFGGFLFPFQRQFFITESEGVRVLGLDPDDEDWERIGRNWVEPKDRDAWRRLRDERLHVLLCNMKRDAAGVISSPDVVRR